MCSWISYLLRSTFTYQLACVWINSISGWPAHKFDIHILSLIFDLYYLIIIYLPMIFKLCHISKVFTHPASVQLILDPPLAELCPKQESKLRNQINHWRACKHSILNGCSNKSWMDWIGYLWVLMIVSRYPMDCWNSAPQRKWELFHCDRTSRWWKRLLSPQFQLIPSLSAAWMSPESNSLNFFLKEEKIHHMVSLMFVTFAGCRGSEMYWYLSQASCSWGW